MSSYDVSKLYEDFIPVVTRLGLNAVNTMSAGNINFAWSFNETTKVLTLTISGDTNYVRLYNTGISKIDLYRIYC